MPGLQELSRWTLGIPVLLQVPRGEGRTGEHCPPVDPEHPSRCAQGTGRTSGQEEACRGELWGCQSSGLGVTGDTTGAGPALALLPAGEGAPSSSWALVLGWGLRGLLPPGRTSDPHGSCQGSAAAALDPLLRHPRPHAPYAFLPDHRQEAGDIVLVYTSMLQFVLPKNGRFSS